MSKEEEPSTYKHLTDADDYAALMASYDVWLFDCDGVLWSGDDLIPGAVAVLEKLRKWGKQIVFVTNNASKSRGALLKKFEKMGIKANTVSSREKERSSCSIEDDMLTRFFSWIWQDEIFSSSYAAAVYLKRVLKFPSDRKVYVIGMEGIEEELDAEGIQHVGGTNKADNQFLPALDFSTLQDEEALDPSVAAVICGFDMHLSYIKLAKAHKHLTRPDAQGEVTTGQKGGGCHFILTNDDSTFPAKGGPWPGAGSLSAPLLFSTKRIPTIIGKPHQPMLDTILEAKQFDKAKAIFVGDRLDTDIEFAINGGIASLMVLTGISKKEEIEGEDAKIVPDFLVQSLGDFDAVTDEDMEQKE